MLKIFLTGFLLVWSFTASAVDDVQKLMCNVYKSNETGTKLPYESKRTNFELNAEIGTGTVVSDRHRMAIGYIPIDETKAVQHFFDLNKGQKVSEDYTLLNSDEWTVKYKGYTYIITRDGGETWTTLDCLPGGEYEKSDKSKHYDDDLDNDARILRERHGLQNLNVR